MNAECILFDLDGTLVDSEQLGTQAIIDLLPELDESLESLTHRYRGHELAAIFRDIEHRLQLRLPNNFVGSYRARMAELFEAELQAFPGADKMLSQLDQAKCIASGGPLDKIQRSLRIAKLQRHFGANIFSSYEIKSWKPEPNLFVHAAAQMGYTPDQCVVIEDSEVGVQAAEAANMRVLHFCPHGTSFYHTSFSQLANLPSLL